MSRPSIPESNYIDAFNAFLERGVAPEDVTVTELQKAVGGRFDRTRDLLVKFKKEHKALQNIPDQPKWYRDKIVQPTKSLTNKLWPLLYEKMQEQAEAIEDKMAEQIKQLENQALEQSQQISLLENKEEVLSEEIERLKNELAKEVGRREEAEKLHLEGSTELLDSQKVIGELRGKLEIYQVLEKKYVTGQKGDQIK